MFRSLSTAVLLFLFALPGVALAQGTGTIAGQVLEADGVTTVIGANVRVDGSTLGAVTDVDGNYRIIGVPVGSYTITASYTGYTSQAQTGVEVNAGYTRQLNFTLSTGTLDEVVVVYEAPLITNDAIGAPRVVTGEDLENLPIRGVAQTVALQGGIVNTEGSNDLNVRGGRAEEVQYIVDGVRVTGGALLGVNQQSIEQQEVLIGTIPARYGDVQSGVISITTKTGRNDFFGSLEGVTSTGLDSFGYNLGSISLGGPIIANRLGFFLSAEGQSTRDANPYGTDTYRLADDAYAALQANPQLLSVTDAAGAVSFIPFPLDIIQGSGPIGRDSLQRVLIANGTLAADSRVTSGFPVSAATTFTADRFETVRGKDDPLRDLTLNGNLNFTFGDVGLRLGGGYVTRNRETFSFVNSLYNRDDFYHNERQNYRFFGTLRQRLSNTAFYQLQGEFQDIRFVQYPEGFSSDISDAFNYGDAENAENAVASRYYTLADITDDGVANPTYQQSFIDDSQVRPGRVVPNTFSLPGRQQLTTYQRGHNQQYRFSGSATAQVGVNQIEFGAEFQQETQRFISLNGFGLAQFATDANTTGAATYNDLTFGQVDDLLGNRYGYNFLGTEEVDDEDLDGFFAETNTNIAPYRPVYYAGYIQDKIEFQDLVVQLGMRVDVFDNNTSVLKDIYAPVPIVRVSDLTSGAPAGIGSDYAVYFVSGNSEGGAIVGYRDTEGNFFDAQGTRASADLITRVRNGQVDPTAQVPNASIFEPYEAQVTVMPRVGVSFPVTDRALFFASYNVTSQRPTERAFAPISFYRELGGQDSQIPNPRLEPEQTTQYEIGFRQRLNDRSAISLSGFYRTQANKITNRSLVGGFPAYGTFLNADFTTTQGAEVNFDLRRTNNLQLSANYTLSFAQGTGSDAGATANIVWRGDFFPQSISPADFDQRHTANVTLDYRLGDAEGPLLGGVRLFENFGINLIGQFGSGQRYTRLEPNTGFDVSNGFTENVSGSINSATLPATTRLDLRVDRAFNLGFSDSRLRAYVQVQNLLDTRNRLAVYRSTGLSDNDGYPDTPDGQTVLANPGNLFNYQAYSGGPLNVGGNQSSGAGFFYSAPRQVRLGFLFDF